MHAASKGVAGRTAQTWKDLLPTKVKRVTQLTKNRDPPFRPSHTVKKTTAMYGLRPSKTLVRTTTSHSDSDTPITLQSIGTELNPSATPFLPEPGAEPQSTRSVTENSAEQQPVEELVNTPINTLEGDQNNNMMEPGATGGEEAARLVTLEQALAAMLQAQQASNEARDRAEERREHRLLELEERE